MTNTDVSTEVGGLWSFFPCASISEVALDYFAVEFLRLSSIIFNSPFEYDNVSSGSRGAYLFYMFTNTIAQALGC